MREPLDRRSIAYVIASAAAFACATVLYDRILNLNSIGLYFPQTNLPYWFWVMNLVGPLLAAAGIGTIADIAGRKAAIWLSVAILSVSLVGTGETLAWIGNAPRSPGIAGTILLVAFHCTSTIAVTAMLISTMVYMFESAPTDLRGLYVAIAVAVQGIGAAIGVAVDDRFFTCAQCIKSISASQELLLAGTILAPFAVLAWNASEPEFRDGYSIQLKKVAFPGFLLMLLLNFAGFATLAVSQALGHGGSGDFANTFLGLVVATALIIVAGFISDRYGRKSTMLVPAFFIAVVPACGLLNHVLSATVLVVVSLLGTLTYEFLRPTIFVALIEMLPCQIRVRSLLALVAVSDGLLAYYQGYKVRGLLVGDLVDWEIVIVIGCCAIALFPNAAKMDWQRASS